MYMKNVEKEAVMGKTKEKASTLFDRLEQQKTPLAAQNAK